MSQFIVTSPEAAATAARIKPTGRETLMDAYQETLNLGEEMRRVLISGQRVAPQYALLANELVRILGETLKNGVRP